MVHGLMTKRNGASFTTTITTAVLSAHCFNIRQENSEIVNTVTVP